jgi:hypothetical protein
MLLLLAVGPRLLPEFRDPQAGRSDILSAALCIATVLAVIYGVKHIAGHGADWLAAATIALGLVIGAVFVRRQWKLAVPFIDLSLFRRVTFSAALAVNIFGFFVALLQRRIHLLRALIVARASLIRGDATRMRLLAEETEALAVQEEVRWKLIALWITFWYIEVIQREGALLIGRLLEAKQQVIAAGDHVATRRVMRWLAFAYWRAGRLRLAEQECLEGLALVEQIGQHSAATRYVHLVEQLDEHSASTGYFHYHLACVYYAWNRLEAAALSVQQLLRIAQTRQQADLLIMGNTYLVWHLLASGDLAAAKQALQQAEDLAQ